MANLNQSDIVGRALSKESRQLVSLLRRVDKLKSKLRDMGFSEQRHSSPRLVKPVGKIDLEKFMRARKLLDKAAIKSRRRGYINDKGEFIGRAITRQVARLGMATLITKITKEN